MCRRQYTSPRLSISILSIGTGICRVFKNKEISSLQASHFTRPEDEISAEQYFTGIGRGTGEKLPWTRQLLLAIFSAKKNLLLTQKKSCSYVKLRTIHVKKKEKT